MSWDAKRWQRVREEDMLQVIAGLQEMAEMKGVLQGEEGCFLSAEGVRGEVVRRVVAVC